MRRIELLDLLGPSAAASQSRSDVLRELAAVSGGRTAFSAETSGSAGLQEPFKNVTDQLTELSRHVTDLNASQQTLAGAMQDNTQAVTRNTAAKGGGSSVASTVEHVASSLFGGAVSFSPIIGGLISLFGGGSKQTVTPLTPFQLPTPVQYQAGLTDGPGGQVVPVDYGQGGQVRPAAAPAPQINIQVSAMDSRSFLDHSAEIASAVRAAMLNSSSLNDVIADL